MPVGTSYVQLIYGHLPTPSFFFLFFSIFFCGIYYYQWDFQILSIEKRPGVILERKVLLSSVFACPCPSLQMMQSVTFYLSFFFFPFFFPHCQYICLCTVPLLSSSFFLYSHFGYSRLVNEAYMVAYVQRLGYYIIIQIPPLIGLCVYICAFACLKKVFTVDDCCLASWF